MLPEFTRSFNPSLRTALHKLLMLAALGLTACFGGAGTAHAALIMHACSSCELDEGGTGVALKNHVRGQLLTGHSVAVVLMDFETSAKRTKQPIEAALADLIEGTPTTDYVSTGASSSYRLTTSKIKSIASGSKPLGGGRLYVFRIAPPVGPNGEYNDQEQSIVNNLSLLPSMQYAIGDIINRVMQAAKNYPNGLYSYQMHVYWNMVLEKELARQLRLSCNWTTDPKSCKKVPVAMWAHSDENAYSGKQPDDERRIMGRTRASVLLKDMISVSDAVFTVSTPSKFQFLTETDVVAGKLRSRNDPTIGQGPFFSLHQDDPKGKGVLVPFKAAWPELCDPLIPNLRDDDLSCNRPHEKYVLPIFNGIKINPLSEQEMVAAKRNRSTTNPDLLRALSAPYKSNDEAWKLLASADSTLLPNFRAAVQDSIAPGDKIVLALGRVNSSKNPLELVRNWEKIGMKNVHLIIAGPPEPESPESKLYFQELMGTIAATNLTLQTKYGITTGKKLIHYVGPTSEAGKLYTMADVFVSPSKAETQGMTVLEAMGVGTPVVANSNVPSYTEFVFDPSAPPTTGGVTIRPPKKEDIGNGFLDDPAQAAFYKKIAAILQNDALAAKVGLRGFKTFPYYSIESIAARTDWAMDVVWSRLNGTVAPTFPLAESAKVPDWAEILK